MALDKTDGIDLYLFTYNCNKQVINADTFITKLIDSFPKEIASLYVFGLEEFCTILDGSFYNIANKHLIEFNELILEALVTKYGAQDIRFQTVGLNHIGSIGMIALSPYPLKFFGLRTALCGFGYGNSSMKGGVGIRLTYCAEGKYSHQSVEYTFANAHLPAYEGEVYYQRRNQSVYTLMRALDFGDGYGLLKPRCHTFVMGDLNYRTTKKHNQDSVAQKRLLALQDQSSKTSWSIEELVTQYDELSHARADGDVFVGFTEGCIEFPPTYKYNLNTAIYNSKRAPSWCDRVLYQSTYEDPAIKEGNVLIKFRKDKESNKSPKLPHIKAYKSITNLLQSDHQPVYLVITVPFTPPKSIVGPSGYLQILPSETPNRHLMTETSSSNVAFEESVSGYNPIYVKPTKYDYFIQTVVRVMSDFIIGYSLWFTTTKQGRLLILLLTLIVWLLNYLLI